MLSLMCRPFGIQYVRCFDVCVAFVAFVAIFYVVSAVPLLQHPVYIGLLMFSLFLLYFLVFRNLLLLLVVSVVPLLQYPIYKDFWLFFCCLFILYQLCCFFGIQSIYIFGCNFVVALFV